MTVLSLLDESVQNLSLTPLEEQVVSIKKKFPDCLLMVECMVTSDRLRNR